MSWEEENTIRCGDRIQASNTNSGHWPPGSPMALCMEAPSVSVGDRPNLLKRCPLVRYRT